jgi:hypothetical protein
MLALRFSFGIDEFPIKSPRLERRLRPLKISSGTMNGNEIEDQQDRIQYSKAGFRAIVQQYRDEEAQSISPPFKISKKLRANFPIGRYKDPDYNE